MDYVAAYHQVGTFRGAAEVCGTTHTTVSRAVKRQQSGAEPEARAPRPRNYDIVEALVTARMKSSCGRMSAKRLLPAARLQGYSGSDRNFRRLVAKARANYRKTQHHGRRPAVWTPSEYLVIDWGADSDRHQRNLVRSRRRRISRYSGMEMCRNPGSGEAPDEAGY